MPTSTWQRVRRSSSALSRTAVQQMETLPWFAALPPQERSYVGLVVHAGIDAFAQWLRAADDPLPSGPEVFSAAPRELARAVTLKQTVQLIRVAVDVVDAAVPRLAAPGEETALREAVLRWSREIGFAAAEVYAATAEARGAWDARVEAGIIDALARGAAGERTQSRATGLGWVAGDWVVALAAPAASDLQLEHLRRSARHSGLQLLVGEVSAALVVVAGGLGTPEVALRQLQEALPPGTVVLGPVVRDLAGAAISVQEALAGLAAAPAWPGAPRPVPATDLLAERAVLGEETARRRLLEEVHRPLAAAGGDLVATAAAYLEGGGSVEGTGRALYLHPNTVRYRLKKVTDVIGYDLTDPRDALVVRLALLLGRTSEL